MTRSFQCFRECVCLSSSLCQSPWLQANNLGSESGDGDGDSDGEDQTVDSPNVVDSKESVALRRRIRIMEKEMQEQAKCIAAQNHLLSRYRRQKKLVSNQEKEIVALKTELKTVKTSYEILKQTQVLHHDVQEQKAKKLQMKTLHKVGVLRHKLQVNANECSCTRHSAFIIKFVVLNLFVISEPGNPC